MKKKYYLFVLLTFLSLPARKKPLIKDNVEQKSIIPTEKSTTETPRSLMIKTNITDDMITYKHWSGNYAPEFKISLNNQATSPHEEKKLFITNNQLEIDYECDFKVKNASVHKSHKKIILEVPAQKDSVEINFSWDDKNRIIAQGTKLIACNPIK